MFKNNVEIMCSSKLPKVIKSPEKVQGSTIKPLIKSGHRLPITFIGCRDPSTLTQLPRDAPPTRPSFRRHQSGSRGKDVWWFCWRTGHRPRPGRDVSRASSRWLVAKQNPFLAFFEKALHWIERLIWSQETICLGLVLVYQWSLIKKTNPKLEATCAAWISHKKDTLCTNVYQLCGASGNSHKIFYTFHHIPTKYETWRNCGSTLYVKILKSLPKQKTTDFLILREVKKNNLIQPARPSH